MSRLNVWTILVLICALTVMFFSCALFPKKPVEGEDISSPQTSPTEQEEATDLEQRQEADPEKATESGEEEYESSPVDKKTGTKSLPPGSGPETITAEADLPADADPAAESTRMSPQKSTPDSDHASTDVLTIGSTEKSAADRIREMDIPPPPPDYHPYLDAERLARDENANQLISLNFNNEPIASVLKALFADTLKLNYILDKTVGGNITIVTSTAFPRKNLFDVILLILKLNGLTVTRAGEYYLIVPTADAMKYMLPTEVGRDSRAVKPSERIITQIVPLNYMSPTEISGIIGQMKSTETQLINLDAANIIIFTGPASNIRRMIEIIEVLDVEVSQEEFRVFEIRFADANDIMQTLLNLFQKKIVSKSIATQKSKQRTQTRKAPQKNPGSTGQGIISVGGTSGEPVMIVDQRSNSLIVFGTKKDMEFVQKIIDILDVDIYAYQEIFIYYLENAEAKDLKAILDELYKGQSQTQKKPPAPPQQKMIEQERPGEVVGDVKIAVDERTNSLIIQTTFRNYKILEYMIKQLDVIPKQVLIEVLIVEVTLDDTMELGFQWSLKSSGKIGDSSFSSTTETNFINEDGIGLNWTIFEATRFTSFLNTFASDSRLEVLSNPHIMCSNNTEAKIDISDEVPRLTSTGIDTTNPSTGNQIQYQPQIEYRSAGIILTVNARVNEKRMVSLDITQEVSDAQEIVLGDITTTKILKRVIQTALVLRDNQTLVMGGLMQRKKNQSDQGIPYLSKIPILRWLFGTERREKKKTELIIFVTPHVVGSPEEVFEKTNEFLDKLPRAEKLKKKRDKRVKKNIEN
ncbi:type II secretion system secretin GspD [candidate division CSSED10-310 bacterium]|uniref:Type II secretion system secretin GspD n=1 Tax=candidate division CSSED10-310 bacterium TaxID=2855610 RepID=A0ABV6YZH1_UNCC1